VLLSGDDLAYPRIGKPEDVRPRARQNVILELGFFLGKLGRNRVLALYRKVHNFELPSDYQRVLYKEFDSAGAWKIELWKELKAAGYSVDPNKLM
jgi:predicted nucleotide-binding protein